MPKLKALGTMSEQDREKMRKVEEIIEKGKLREIFENPEIKIAMKADNIIKGGRTNIAKDKDARNYFYFQTTKKFLGLERDINGLDSNSLPNMEK
jgi:hypothetical protein